MHCWCRSGILPEIHTIKKLFFLLISNGVILSLLLKTDHPTEKEVLQNKYPLSLFRAKSLHTGHSVQWRCLEWSSFGWWYSSTETMLRSVAIVPWQVYSMCYIDNIRWTKRTGKGSKKQFKERETVNGKRANRKCLFPVVPGLSRPVATWCCPILGAKTSLASVLNPLLKAARPWAPKCHYYSRASPPIQME